jgi:hypothetical protein
MCFFLCFFGGGLCSCMRRHAGVADTRVKTPLAVCQYCFHSFFGPDFHCNTSEE